MENRKQAIHRENRIPYSLSSATTSCSIHFQPLPSSHALDDIIPKGMSTSQMKDCHQIKLVSCSSERDVKTSFGETSSALTELAPLITTPEQKVPEQYFESQLSSSQSIGTRQGEGRYSNRKSQLRKMFSHPIQKKIMKKKTKAILDLGPVADLREIKNIPKNYAKAILNFILRNPAHCKHVLPIELIHPFLEHLRLQRKITNLKEFNRLVIDHKDYKKKTYNSAFRSLSRYFLNHVAVNYIFNSKILQAGWHLKYRNGLLKALAEPQDLLMENS